MSYGGYQNRKTNSTDVTVGDLGNLWNIFKLFSKDNDLVLNKMRSNQLLQDNDIIYPKCGEGASWRKRKNRTLGGLFLCKNKHMAATTMYSFFQNSKIDVRDIMLMLRLNLDNHSLRLIAIRVGVNYKCTTVTWASYVREVMVDRVYGVMPSMKLNGDVEVDESLFGRRVERSSKRLILYPVEDRSRETLMPLIRRHIDVGCHIFNDGWSSYLSLVDEGYQHFVVNHKEHFKQVYRNVETGERLTVHTNTIEGSWKHAKEKFRAMNGIGGYDNFEQHLREVLYRRMFPGRNLVQQFLGDLTSIYTLRGPPTYFVHSS